MTFRNADDYMAWMAGVLDDKLRRFETDLLVEPIDVDELDALMTEQRAMMAERLAQHRIDFLAWLATMPQDR